MSKTPWGVVFSRFESALKLRYMGVGLLWAWLYTVYYTPVIIDERAGLSINADQSWFVSAVVVVVVLFVFGIGWRKQTKPRAGHIIAATLALTVGTALTGLGSSLGTAVSFVGGLMTGVGYGMLSLLWALALQPISLDELEIAIPVSTLMVLPCVLVFPLLSGVAGLLAALCVPLGSGVLLLILCFGSANAGNDTIVSDATYAGTTPVYVPSPTQKTIPYLLLISALICLVYAAIGWISSLSEVRDGVYEFLNIDISSLISCLVAVLFAVLLVSFSDRVSFSGLLRWVVPAIIIALVLFVQPGGSTSFLVNVITLSVDALAQVLVFLFALSLAKAKRISAVLGVGVVSGFLQLGVLVGNVLGTMDFDQYLCGLTLICLLAASTAFIPQRGMLFDSQAELLGHDNESGLEASCRALQQQFKLSDRETEILLLLAEGRTRPYIRERLFISSNTVATHIKHIYRKLDIHSKEELIDLVKMHGSV